MTTQIELQNMKFYAYHGVGEQESCVGNQFRVDLLLTASLERAVASDQLDDTINYATVYSIVKDEMEVRSQLLEHVGGRILHALKQQFPQLQAIEIKVTKMTPPFGGDVESAAVLLQESYVV